MNCRDIQPFLDQLANPPVDGGMPGQSGMREHVAICPGCQRAVRSLAQWDHQIAATMNDIAIPNGLSRRLAAAVHDASPVDPDSPPRTSARFFRRVWSRTAGIGCIGCLLLAAIWQTQLLLRPSTLSAGNLTGLLQSATHPFDPASITARQVPRGWSSLRQLIVAGEWNVVESRHLKLNIAVLPFETRLKRDEQIQGALYVIPKTRWTPSPATLASEAPLQYSPPHVWVAWPEGEFVYILSLNGSPQVLEQLQRKLDGNHSVL
jgi:hypothetical protein